MKLQHKHDDNELRKIIGSIEFVRSREKSTAKGTEIFYFSEHPNQEHLVKMIRKQKPASKNTPPKFRRQFSNSTRRANPFYRAKKPRANSTTAEDENLAHSGCESLTNVEVKDTHNDSAFSCSTTVESNVRKIIKFVRNIKYPLNF